MPRRSNDTTRLLDAESVEAEIIDSEYSQPPTAPPPSYEIATGSSFNRDPISSQPAPTLFYGYTYLQPTAGQFPVAQSITDPSSGQPIFVIPVTAQPVANSQPILVHQYKAHRNTRECDEESLPDPHTKDCSCTDCCIACLCCLEITKVCFECLNLMAECSKK